MRPRRVILLAAHATLLAACSSAPQSAPSSASLAMPPRCQTAAHLDEIRNRPFVAPPSSKFDAELGYRPFVEGLSARALSPHFALAWGDALSVVLDAAQADALLASLEVAFAEEVERRGFPLPDGANAFRMNVLIGDSGEGLPLITFEGAYATRDAQGYPFIVVHPALAVRPATQSAAVLAHEFFHTTQFSTAAYTMWRPSERSHWYVEAAADWMADQLYPLDFMTHVSIALYALQPHRSLELFGDTDEPVLGFHQYGASLFATYLSEFAADPEVVFHSWTQPPVDSRALFALDGLLALADDDLAERFADFAAHTAVWDYPRGDAYRAAVVSVASTYEQDDARIVANVVGLSPDWLSAPVRTRPEAWAYNVVRFTPGAARDVAVGVSGDLRGQAGSESRWRARVIVEHRQSPPTHHVLPLVEGAGDLALAPLTDDVTALYLVVAAVPRDSLEAEQFDYRYRFFSPLAGTAPAAPGPGGAPASKTVGPSPEAGCAVVGKPHRRDGVALGPWLLALALAWACRARKSDPPLRACSSKTRAS